LKNIEKLGKNLKKNRAGGQAPLQPPIKAFKVPKYLFSASHWPDVVAIRLVVVADVAAAEVHVPCVAGVVRVRGGRPIVVRLHARERITFCPWTRSSSIRECWPIIFLINHRLPLLSGRQTPHPSS
jgi:hypothetical protein